MHLLTLGRPVLHDTLIWIPWRSNINTVSKSLGWFLNPLCTKREVIKSIHCHTGKMYPVGSFRQCIIQPVLTVIKNLDAGIQPTNKICRVPPNWDRQLDFLRSLPVPDYSDSVISMAAAWLPLKPSVCRILLVFAMVVVPLCELYDMLVLSSVPDLLLVLISHMTLLMSLLINYPAAAQQWSKCSVSRTRFSTSASLETNR